MDYLNTLRTYLAKCDTNGVVDIIKENHINLDDLLPIVVSQLNRTVKLANPDLFDCSKLALETIVEVCDPEDVLLSLLEDVKFAVDDTSFVTLAFSLLRVLLRLPKKRLCSLGWGLNAVSSYYGNLPGDTERITGVCLDLLPFYRRLVANLSANFEERIVVLKYALQLLGRPLALLNFEATDVRKVAEDAIELLFDINADLFSFADLDVSSDIGEVDKLALATLFYLVLTEGIMLEKVPKVYRNTYVFQSCVPLITELLKQECTICNALRLAENLMDRLTGCLLSSHLLDSEHHEEFCKTISNVIVYNDDRSIRQRALNVYRRYLFLFDHRGRYLLVYNLTNVLHNPGIIGYTITRFKDMLVEALREEPLSPYFSDENLFVLLDRFCFLQSFEETHLLQTSERTLAVLNLLRFLMLRDRENVTGVRDHLKSLHEQFLEPLKEGITLARNLHKAQMEDLSASDPKLVVTVEGNHLPDLSREEKLKCLQFGIVTFDMIDDLLSRLCEIINL